LASVLSGTALFAALKSDALEALAGKSLLRSYRRGQHIFIQGDPSDALYILVEGRVKVVAGSEDGDEVLFATLSPPDVFGELAALDGGPRSATVEALETVRAVAVPRSALLDALQGSPAVADALLVALGQVVRRTSEQIADLVFLDLPGRVAKLIGSLAGSLEPGAALDLNLTQRDIAGLVGGSRQSVNQILHSFVRLGYLQIDGRQVIVVRPDALRRRGGLA
jgi:CRP-like cAMP-binding protein